MAIILGLGIRTLITSYDHTTTTVVSTLKSVLKIIVLHFWWKSLKNTCDGSSIFSKATGYIFIKNILLHMFLNGCVLRSCKPRFLVWKKKKLKKMTVNTFRVCCFGKYVFPMRCIESWNWNIEAMLTRVRNKPTVCLLLIQWKCKKYWIVKKIKENQITKQFYQLILKY